MPFQIVSSREFEANVMDWQEDPLKAWFEINATEKGISIDAHLQKENEDSPID